uniref:Uncharacterized protein n=1 Tax=Vitis vinifera TaxID=29760 RepID=F6HTC0_VITVI
MSHVSDIKLIRTDTTLDLSQKAEKGMLCNGFSTPFYSMQGDHTKSQQPHHLTALTVYDTEEIKKKALKTSLPDLKTN